MSVRADRPRRARPVGLRPKPKPYALHGQVIAITPDRRVLTIKHDDIQGFMPAMTMPYEVTEPSISKDLVVGDVIDATLLVFESGVPKLSTITRTGHAPMPADAPVRSRASCSPATSSQTTRCRIYTGRRDA